VRDWTDFLLRMGFGPSTLPRSAPLEGWASRAGGTDVLFGLSAVGKEDREHLLANTPSVLTIFPQPRRLPVWTQQW